MPYAGKIALINTLPCPIPVADHRLWRHNTCKLSCKLIWFPELNYLSTTYRYLKPYIYNFMIIGMLSCRILYLVGSLCHQHYHWININWPHVPHTGPTKLLHWSSTNDCKLRAISWKSNVKRSSQFGCCFKSLRGHSDLSSTFHISRLARICTEFWNISCAKNYLNAQSYCNLCSRIIFATLDCPRNERKCC